MLRYYDDLMEDRNDIWVKFQAFMDQRGWFEKQGRVLLAVSGGLDSIVMVDLFRQSKLPFGIAHCNFQLRGEDSEGDEIFVEQLAKTCDVPFYTKRFSTEKLAGEQKKSIQVLARELRYEWLEEVRTVHRYQWIATAHHTNDAIETALYNWTKGSGLRGLLGIPLQNAHVIRPLMFATRQQLEAYVARQSLAFRTDVSNLEDKYNRNKIRHHILPVLKKINPSLEQTFQANFERLGEVEIVYNWALEQLRTAWTKKDDQGFRIAIQPLQTFPAARTLLYEWLKEFHFTNKQTAQIYKSLEHDPGAVFYSRSHRALLDREWLMIAPLVEAGEKKTILIHQDDRVVHLPEGKLSLTIHPGRPETFAVNRSQANLDADQLIFPLQLRRWQPGDRFAPLGMQGKHQKLQDFFSNQKLSLFEKESIWLLLDSSGEVAWVVGLRLAETFKITDKTKAYLRLHFEKM